MHLRRVCILLLLDGMSYKYFFFFFVFCLFFRVAPTACGGSQARGQIGAVAASLH